MNVSENTGFRLIVQSFPVVRTEIAGERHKRRGRRALRRVVRRSNAVVKRFRVVAWISFHVAWGNR